VETFYQTLERSTKETKLRDDFLTCVRKRVSNYRDYHGQEKEPNHSSTPSSWLQTPRKMTDCFVAGELIRCIPVETAQSNEMLRANSVVAELPAVRDKMYSYHAPDCMGPHQESLFKPLQTKRQTPHPVDMPQTPQEPFGDLMPAV
jgi:hypothetical protein